MKKVQIYDPAMCCPTGVCGPGVDPDLTRLATVLHSLEKKGFVVERYNLANEPGAFTENKVINDLLHQSGTEALPAVLVDGNIVKEGQYPTNEEFAEWFEIEASALEEKKPETPLNFTKL
ncbi:arsenite efflux transporter metallochaperone ArsD [Halobacillus sp. A1]|uniref:arsenite efflux transporter metallochaperone ArsD n=1 Tax=Halobacillus sp. A1 TaxID=2880262 RepID=UPI0020A67C5B|nr:arsenite efflux transporter metallochaperone ArsD [Halobacillus sp. A1]MCP3033087.1 arsenite efflux transporter metallochaperone ArsD [Halobacillus sp. A1]